MELKKLPKLTNVLVISFDKFHNLCNLYIFGLCFVVQEFSFKFEISLTELIKFSLKSTKCWNNYMKYTTLPYTLFNHSTHHKPNNYGLASKAT